jgi:hypothetical protein
LWNIPVFLKNKNKNDLIKLKRTILESKFFKNVIISHFETMLPQEFDLNTYKVYKCPLGENCFVDYHLCLNYHDPRERRRDPIFYKIEKNEYCPHIRAEGRLLDPEKCKNGDFCEFLHTKNELNYDVRNFRRITDCQRNKKRKCEFFDVCYGKHYNEKGKQVDNSISNVTEEINILQKQKEELLLNLQNNNEKMLVYEKEIKKIEKDISQLRCNNQNCPNPYNLAIRILNCKHYYCDPCFKEILETKICLKCHVKIEKLENNKGNYMFFLDKLG